MSVKTMSDLQPGDYFVQKVFADDLIVYLYGFFERRTPDGLFAGHMNHNSGIILDGRVLSKAQHELVSIISERAYRYAERHGWPTDENGVARVIHYSAQQPGIRTFFARLFKR